MSTPNSQDIRTLLDEEKFDEAKAAIQKLIEQPIDDREQGEQVVKMLVAYMQYMTDLNEEYADTLDEAMALLSDIDKREQEAMEEFDTEEEKLKKT